MKLEDAYLIGILGATAIFYLVMVGLRIRWDRKQLEKLMREQEERSKMLKEIMAKDKDITEKLSKMAQKSSEGKRK